MRILHTSDWHLGTTLEGVSREKDHAQFLAWLVEAIREHEVDVLIVAGDVFDHDNPSAEALGQYYRFLHDLAGTSIRQVVVVGGNHDSGARLDAPRRLLQEFRVHVVGGLESGEEGRKRCLCPVYDEAGACRMVVASVPFTHEWRLGFRMTEGTSEERQAALGEPFRQFYADLADLAEAQWPGVPLVATGHLACAGSEKDDAPQEIHLIGSLGGLPTGIFDGRYAYIALGHIHRAYRVGGTKAWYSGSPIALNVKEGRRPRTVNLVHLGSDGISVNPIEIPKTRKVLEVQGNSEEVKKKLEALTWDTPLPPMVLVDLEVKSFQIGLEEEIRGFVAGLEPRPLLLDIHQTRLAEGAKDPNPEGTPPPARLKDLDPGEVFRMLCDARGEHADELMEAFSGLLGMEGKA